MSTYIATDVSTSYLTGVAASQPAAAAAPARQPPKAHPDTVHLSQSAQILLLNHQGESASQIGKSMGLTTAVVDADLNITVATVAVAAPAAAAPVAAPPAK